MGWPKKLKHSRPKGKPSRRPEVLPVRTGTCSSASSAHLSDRSTRFRHQPCPSSLSNRKAWPKMLLPALTPRLRPHDRGSREAYSSLFSDRRTKGRLEPSDRGLPVRKEPEDVRRKARHGSQVKTTVPGAIPCTKQCSAATLTQKYCRGC